MNNDINALGMRAETLISLYAERRRRYGKQRAAYTVPFLPG